MQVSELPAEDRPAGETAAFLQDLEQRAADKARELDSGPTALL